MAKSILFVFTLLLITAGHSMQSIAMSIDDAYAQLSKKRVIYDPYASQLSSNEQSYLNNLFILVDQAVALRMDLLNRLQSGSYYDIHYYHRSYEDVIAGIYHLNTPSNLYQVQSQIIDALRDQWSFFSQWHSAAEHEKSLYTNYASHPHVRSSSRKLISAYNTLMRVYSKETAHNKKAFYTHLCALDFI